MAFVVLFSTMSFTVDMHFCGDVLVDSSMLSSAESCGMETQDLSSEECVTIKKSCCDDKQIVVAGQNELQITFDKLSLKQQKLITSFVYAFINPFDSVQENKNSYTDYKTPLVVKDIQKLDETYLI
ncbi:hypothetical protein KCTC32516_00603 [Polaribacter huanghezhanensis]|nr:hypothetical protein KCTC32516_00603 [Polaribacter huanghezhanensis]